jgi:hypothetical protein
MTAVIKAKAHNKDSKSYVLGSANRDYLSYFMIIINFWNKHSSQKTKKLYIYMCRVTASKLSMNILTIQSFYSESEMVSVFQILSMLIM